MSIDSFLPRVRRVRAVCSSPSVKANCRRQWLSIDSLRSLLRSTMAAGRPLTQSTVTSNAHQHSSAQCIVVDNVYRLTVSPVCCHPCREPKTKSCFFGRFLPTETDVFFCVRFSTAKSRPKAGVDCSFFSDSFLPLSPTPISPTYVCRKNGNRPTPTPAVSTKK